MTNDSFYKSTAWAAARERILMRDDCLCQRCKARGKIRIGKVAHHIVHLREAPELALTESNLMTVCVKCHEQLHPERRRRKGMEGGDDGDTLIVKL